MKKYNNIIVEINRNIAVLTFNRPEVLNALNTETIAEVSGVVNKLKKNPGVRVLVLTGTGKAFVAGADILEMIKKNPEEAREYSKLGQTLMNTIQNMDKPVIGAINGFALGGGLEIALACDIRLASEKAGFGLPETMLGVIPGWGATQRAARLIGSAMTKELIFTGEIIDAGRALETGLVNRIIPHDDLMNAAMSMAEKICRHGQIAISHAKMAINKGADNSLEQGYNIETDAFAACFKTADQKEGMQAFLDKRAPEFKGK